MEHVKAKNILDIALTSCFVVEARAVKLDAIKNYDPLTFQVYDHRGNENAVHQVVVINAFYNVDNQQLVVVFVVFVVYLVVVVVVVEVDDLVDLVHNYDADDEHDVDAVDLALVSQYFHNVGNQRSGLQIHYLVFAIAVHMYGMLPFYQLVGYLHYRLLP